MNLKWHSTSKDRYFGMELTSMHQEISRIYTKRHADCKKMNKKRLAGMRKFDEPLASSIDHIELKNNPESIFGACKRVFEMIQQHAENNDIKQIQVRFM
jgi:hypothetical protein